MKPIVAWRSMIRVVHRASARKPISGPNIRPFSASAHRSIMELSGFSEEQLTVRDAISKICQDFPDVSSV